MQMELMIVLGWTMTHFPSNLVSYILELILPRIPILDNNHFQSAALG